MPSIGTVAESHNNAVAGIINGYYKDQLIHGPARAGPWRNAQDVELVTSSWVHWTRLHGYLGDIRTPRSSQRSYAAQRRDRTRDATP